MLFVLFLATVLSSIYLSWSDDNYLSKWDNTRLEHSAYGYFKRIGISEAKRVYMEEDSQYLMPRIVGGETANIKQYNYQAGLIISLVNFTGFGLCGGSLISANKVATAAHCWFDGLHQGSSVIVVLGSATVFSGGTRVNSSKVIVHPGWNPSLAQHDVAVIYLPSPVKFSENIAPIALPMKSEIYECLIGKTVIASGFGKIGEGIPVAADQSFSSVNLTVISNEECLQTYPRIIQDSNICTSGNSTSGHVAICSGDSGGPLAFFENKKILLVGIASFGSSLGCNVSFPNAFARVSSHLDFFEKHIKTKIE